MKVRRGEGGGVRGKELLGRGGGGLFSGIKKC